MFNYFRNRAMCACLAVIPLALASPSNAQDYVLRAPNIIAQPGDVVSIPILFDNNKGPVAGWSFGVTVGGPLVILDADEGIDISHFNGGAGPDFASHNIYPGVGVTVGIVLDFQGAEVLELGTNLQLHMIDVQIPANAPLGTSYPIKFVDTIGSPPVAIVVVENGQSMDPQLDHGTITIGDPHYCGPAVPNSSGFPGEITASGVYFAGGYPLTLTADHLPTNQFGYFLVSQTAGLVVGPGGSQGNLCLGGSIGRFRTQVQFSGGSGAISIPVDTTSLPVTPMAAIQPGDTWHFTTWFRDVNPGATSNFTNGITLYFH